MIISSFNAIIDYITPAILVADDNSKKQTSLMSRSKPVQLCILMKFPWTRQFPFLALNETDATGRESARLPTGLNDRRRRMQMNACA